MMFGLRCPIIMNYVVLIVVMVIAKQGESATKISTSCGGCTTITKLEDTSFKKGAKIGFTCKLVSKPLFRAKNRPKITFESETIIHKTRIVIEGNDDFDFVCKRDQTRDKGSVRPQIEVEEEVEDMSDEKEEVEEEEEKTNECPEGARCPLLDKFKKDLKKDETTTTEDEEEVSTEAEYEYCYEGTPECDGEPVPSEDVPKAEKALKINVINVGVEQRGKAKKGKKAKILKRKRAEKKQDDE